MRSWIRLIAFSGLIMTLNSTIFPLASHLMMSTPFTNSNYLANVTESRVGENLKCRRHISLCDCLAVLWRVHDRSNA
jgi:hypothetical protein